MAKKDQDGCAALAFVAIAAFLVGRFSVSDKAPEPASESTPSALYDETGSPSEAADPAEPSDAASDIGDVEPEAPPVRFVSPAPSRRSGTAFRNCSEARAAGAAPVMADDPGYAPRLDRDGDGVGCE